ncbi:MAG: glutamate racemase [Candidatus Omnitrophica bacterium]|nr:glutamate racemase [Candidatus Omnitrophota bacterium]
MPTANTKAAIGVFDSGLGGLTVVKELTRHLPHENIVYFGDTARVPYGTKSKEAIIQFSIENTEALLEHNVKMVVVACNSSSSYAIDRLKKKFSVPILGVIVPGAKKAAATSRCKKIGVIATAATINSGRYTAAVKKFCRDAKVYGKACPLFVPLVEEGWLDNKITSDIAETYLKDLKKSGIDTLILGCTHYPLLKTTLQQVMGQKVFLVDSAYEVAREVESILKKNHLLRMSSVKGKTTFIVSDKPQAFEVIAKKFLGYTIKAKVRGHYV